MLFGSVRVQTRSERGDAGTPAALALCRFVGVSAVVSLASGHILRDRDRDAVRGSAGGSGGRREGWKNV